MLRESPTESLLDLLTDCAVIRTSFDTLDVFPDEPEVRVEINEIITSARGLMDTRLSRLREDLTRGRRASDPETLTLFRREFLIAATRGISRRRLDLMMKVDVFATVARCEPGSGSVGLYRYELRPERTLEELEGLGSAELLACLVDDLLLTVRDDRNYAGRRPFDREVFQKLVALLFLGFAATDPFFHNRDAN